MSKPRAKDKAKRGPDELFYSGQFSTEELALVAAFVSEPSLDDELWLQRVVNHRLFRYFDETHATEPIGIGTLVKLAAALGAGAVRVARLLRDRQALSGSSADSMQAALTRVLNELSNELGTKL